VGKFRHIFVLETVLCSYFLVLFYLILVREKGGVPLPYWCHSGKVKIHYFDSDADILSGNLREHWSEMQDLSH